MTLPTTTPRGPAGDVSDDELRVTVRTVFAAESLGVKEMAARLLKEKGWALPEQR